MITQETVLEEVAAIVRDVIGEAWAQDIPIVMTSSFSRDLELESIEFVALAERLKAKYGTSVDFAAWLGTMELSEILALQVGQLVEHIVSCTSTSTKA